MIYTELPKNLQSSLNWMSFGFFFFTETIQANQTEEEIQFRK